VRSRLEVAILSHAATGTRPESGDVLVLFGTPEDLVCAERALSG
jgi:hypothetical protein